MIEQEEYRLLDKEESVGKRLAFLNKLGSVEKGMALDKEKELVGRELVVLEK